MAASGAADKADDSLYPIAVLIDELKNEDIQVNTRQLPFFCSIVNHLFNRSALQYDDDD